MNRRLFLMVSLIALMGMVSMPPVLFAAEVVQGICTKLDEQAKTLTMELYDTVFDKENPYGKSTGEVIEINYATSLIGVKPEVGNVLRVAFVKKDNINAAIRLMNVTKQGKMNK